MNEEYVLPEKVQTRINSLKEQMENVNEQYKQITDRLRSNLNAIITTVIEMEGLDVNYTLSDDFSKLIKTKISNEKEEAYVEENVVEEITVSK